MDTEKNRGKPEEQMNTSKAQNDGSYHIHRTTKLYKDVPVQLSKQVVKGCAIDSNIYNRGKEDKQGFRQAEDIVLLKLSLKEMKGELDDLTEEHMVKSEEIAKIVDQNGYVTVDTMKEHGITALFTDHTRIGELDFVDIDHIASEIRRIDTYCYRHDSSIEETGEIDTSGPTAWQLVGVNLSLETAYWESKEEYHHQNFFKMLAMKSIK
ncbi:MAG: hypothetical protein ACLFQV_08705 [Vulcanimicrobiota bacterium]